MDAGLDRLNALPADGVREQLRACCAAQAWIEAVAASRPYASREDLHAASATALDALPWEGVRQALDAHPRIGERMAAAAGREAAWSASEQSGMDGASQATREALVEANRAYEERFGHVFLIFATGRTDEEMLAAARERVHNDVATEQETVRSELGRIVALRLTKLLDAP
jgi:2-oxo-4-hydroxy-4-carboxy-5-ureidoimidazoline decarboxylase